MLRRQAQRLTRSVSDRLHVARIAADKLHLGRAPVDLKTIVGEAVDATKYRGRTIEVALPGNAMVVDGDATRLDQW